MKSFKLYALLVVVAMLFAACAPAVEAPAAEAPAAEAPAQAELKLGIIAALTGPAPTYGEMVRDGAMLAINEWNANGGVNGMQIVPLVEDGQCTADPAVNAANKLINQDEVKFIVGETCSGATIPASDVANAAGVLMISPTASALPVTVDDNGDVKPFIFRGCFIDPYAAAVGARYAFNSLGFKTAFVMSDQANDYSKGLAESFTAEFTALGGTVVGSESYTGKDTDFSAILAKVAETNPDVVYLPDYYNVVNLVTKQAKEKGIGSTFLGSDGWDSSDLDKAAAAGGYFTNHYSPEDPRPEVQTFVSNFKAAYDGKVPDALGVLAYDATNLLLTAIRDANSTDPAVVKDVMAAINFPGVAGSIKFDENHNPLKGVTILKVTEEKVEIVEVVNPE